MMSLWMTSFNMTYRNSIYPESIHIHHQLFLLDMNNLRWSIRPLRVSHCNWQTCGMVSHFCHKDPRHTYLLNYAEYILRHICTQNLCLNKLLQIHTQLYRNIVHDDKIHLHWVCNRTLFLRRTTFCTLNQGLEIIIYGLFSSFSFVKT